MIDFQIKFRKFMFSNFLITACLFIHVNKLCLTKVLDCLKSFGIEYLYTYINLIVRDILL